jgi:hypothetical protein
MTFTRAVSVPVTAMLRGIVERLDDEFPTLPHGLVEHCVDEATYYQAPVGADTVGFVAGIETTARAELVTLASVSAALQRLPEQSRAEASERLQPPRGAQRLAAKVAVEQVDVQPAVEVSALVLEAARQ